SAHRGSLAAGAVSTIVSTARVSAPTAPRDPTPRCGAVLVVTMLSNPPRLASNQPDPEAPDTVWCPRDRVARLEPVHAIGPTWRCSTSHQETSHYGDDVWGYGAIS